MAQEGNQIRFGVFEVRCDTRELRKGGIRIKLEDQPFLVLLALLENPGAIVTRTELRARIWPDGTFVDFDKSLTKAVNKIRTALDDSAATPRFIETLSRRGYRFIAPVSAATEPAPPVPEQAAPPGKRPWRTRTQVVAAGLSVVLVSAGVLTLLAVRNGSRVSASVPPIQSLAVLPIVNLTGDPAQEYFVDGLTDDLISNLSRIGALRVISDTSAMHYKGTRKSLPEIARELGVDGVIEGSAQRTGGSMRLNMKLVRAGADRQLWSESYEGEASEAANLEGRVALAVAHQVSAHLTAEATARMTEGRPVNPLAYDAYLHGRYLWNLRGRDAITQAAGYFEQAVRQDPHFALAWSGLADRYTIGWEAKSDPALAEQYARKALALDGNLAEAHVSLGFAQVCLRRFADAEKELKRGIELNPNYATAHQLYAVYLLTMGRLVEALAENDHALQLDPFSLPVNNLRGLILLGLHQYDRAEENMRTAAQLAPESDTPENNLARIYWIEHRVPEALASERRAVALAPGPEAEKLLRGQAEVEAAFAKSGFQAACLRSVQLKERTSAPGLETHLQYGLLEDKEKVLEGVSQQVGRTGYAVIYVLKTAPEFDFIRSDARFQDLLRRIGLPP
jgi:TolB-like protein/DNA-binding winged helix-turn-helix (wHTH) protein/Tfp pilus assembly protein PilF